MSVLDNPLAAVSLAELASQQPEVARQLNLLRQAAVGSGGVLERGVVVMGAGEVTVPSAFVSKNSMIVPFYVNRKGITGVAFSIEEIVDGESFVIRSSSRNDESEVGYLHLAV